MKQQPGRTDGLPGENLRILKALGLLEVDVKALEEHAAEVRHPLETRQHGASYAPQPSMDWQGGKGRNKKHLTPNRAQRRRIPPSSDGRHGEWRGDRRGRNGSRRGEQNWTGRARGKAGKPGVCRGRGSRQLPDGGSAIGTDSRLGDAEAEDEIPRWRSFVFSRIFFFLLFFLLYSVVLRTCGSIFRFFFLTSICVQ